MPKFFSVIMEIYLIVQDDIPIYQIPTARELELHLKRISRLMDTPEDDPTKEGPNYLKFAEYLMCFGESMQELGKTGYPEEFVEYLGNNHIRITLSECPSFSTKKDLETLLDEEHHVMDDALWEGNPGDVGVYPTEDGEYTLGNTDFIVKSIIEYEA